MPLVHFQINYRTRWGQTVVLVPTEGDALPLDHSTDGNWELLRAVDPGDFSYEYQLHDEAGNVLARESNGERTLHLLDEPMPRTVRDQWRAHGHDDNPLYSSPFTEVIFRQDEHEETDTTTGEGSRTVTFRPRVLRVLPHERLFVTGNAQELGNWSNNHVLFLDPTDFPVWHGELRTDASELVYKYGILDTKTGESRLETGDDRRADLSAGAITLHDEYFRHQRTHWRGTGVAVPVFSLRTERGFGTGEFADLPALTDWAQSTGMNLVQILPVNDTTAKHTWVDSYPYAAISVFALHPMYLALEELPGFEKYVDQKEFEKLKKQLNASETVDYEGVMTHKLRLARQVFDKTRTAFLRNKEYLQFLEENRNWLLDYAAFRYLRDKNDGFNFNNWTEGSTHSPELIAKLSKPRAKSLRELQFHCYIQFHLDRQLRAAAAYARSRGLVLKGDIPIGIYRYSVDAWVAPELYNMNGQAGAPPDPFSETGQNWGFPTYDWDRMAQNGYRWWQQRLQQLSRYFDTFRIDHILGFFRIWEIPLHSVEGLLGRFNKALPGHRSELTERGIYADVNRLTEPYIAHEEVLQIFGADADFVIQTFLEGSTFGYYRFRPELDTQRKVEAWFEEHGTEENEPWRIPLYRLRSNVLLLPTGDPNEFHPRIKLTETSSFAALAPDQQHLLRELHDDYFYRRQEDFWREQAMQKLPAIKAATDMLICGEDLGMVPASVPGVMEKLEFLVLRVQQMTSLPGEKFLQNREVPYWSVVSPGTHDMPPLRLWWTELDDRERAQFFYQEMHGSGPVPAELSAQQVEQILHHQLDFGGMWTIYPLQDLLGMDAPLRHPDPATERINVPAIIPHYWRWRSHVSMEELEKADGFTERVRALSARTDG